MASSCTSTRCTKCGKKKRTFESMLLIEEYELLDSEVFDGLWSPLESLQGRFSPASSRLRLFLSRFKPRSPTMLSERGPLTADYYENLSSYYPPIASTFQVQAYL